MSRQLFSIGRRVTGQVVTASLDEGFQCLVCGSSGSGKSNAAAFMLLQAMKAYRADLQVVIIDPKTVSFLGWESRAYVYSDPNDYIALIDALTSEMERRYQKMHEKQSSSWRSLGEPFILLVIDEMAAFTNCQTLTKNQRDGLSSKLINLSNQIRQAGMGAMYLCQQPDASVIPTVVRGNCTSRIVLRTLSPQALDMAANGRVEECRADLLTHPGMFYGITSETNGMFVKGRAPFITEETLQAELQHLSMDKRSLYCLNWDDPAFLG